MAFPLLGALGGSAAATSIPSGAAALSGAAAPVISGWAAPSAGMVSNTPSLAGLGSTFKVPQGADFLRAGGGGLNQGGPLSMTGRPMPMTSTQAFDRFYSPQSAGLDPSSDALDRARDSTREALEGLGGMDRRLGNLIYPSRSTNRWQPNDNPGLAGLMKQLEATYAGGLGTGGRR